MLNLQPDSSANQQQIGIVSIHCSSQNQPPLRDIEITHSTDERILARIFPWKITLFRIPKLTGPLEFLKQESLPEEAVHAAANHNLILMRLRNGNRALLGLGDHLELLTLGLVNISSIHRLFGADFRAVRTLPRDWSVGSRGSKSDLFGQFEISHLGENGVFNVAFASKYRAAWESAGVAGRFLVWLFARPRSSWEKISARFRHGPSVWLERNIVGAWGNQSIEQQKTGEQMSVGQDFTVTFDLRSRGTFKIIGFRISSSFAEPKNKINKKKDLTPIPEESQTIPNNEQGESNAETTNTSDFPFGINDLDSPGQYYQSLSQAMDQAINTKTLYQDKINEPHGVYLLLLVEEPCQSLIEGEMQLSSFRRMLYRLPLTFQVLASPRGISQNLDCFDLTHELESTRDIFKQVREDVIDFWALDSKNSFLFLLKSDDLCFLTRTQVLFIVIEEADKQMIEARYSVGESRVFSLSQLFGCEVERYEPKIGVRRNISDQQKRERLKTERLKDTTSVWANAFSETRPRSEKRIFKVIENNFEKTILRFDLPKQLTLVIQCLKGSLVFSAFPVGAIFTQINMTKQTVLLENVHPLEFVKFGNPNFYQLVPNFAIFCQLQVASSPNPESKELDLPCLTQDKEGCFRDCSFEYLREIEASDQLHIGNGPYKLDSLRGILEKDFQVMNTFGGALFGDAFLFSAMEHLFLLFTYSTTEDHFTKLNLLELSSPSTNQVLFPKFCSFDEQNQKQNSEVDKSKLKHLLSQNKEILNVSSTVINSQVFFWNHEKNAAIQQEFLTHNPESEILMIIRLNQIEIFISSQTTQMTWHQLFPLTDKKNLFSVQVLPHCLILTYSDGTWEISKLNLLLDKTDSQIHVTGIELKTPEQIVNGSGGNQNALEGMKDLWVFENIGLGHIDSQLLLFQMEPPEVLNLVEFRIFGCFQMEALMTSDFCPNILGQNSDKDENNLIDIEKAESPTFNALFRAFSFAGTLEFH